MSRLASAITAASMAAAATAQPAGQWLGGGISRVFETEAAFQAAPPSFLLEHPPREPLPLSAGFALKPQYGEADGRRTVSFSFPDGTSYYGLGVHAGPFNRTGVKTEPVDMPWVLAVRPDGTAVGLGMDTTYRCWVDLSTGVRFITDDPSPSFMSFDVPEPVEAVRGLNEASGRMEMPPLWALGHRQAAGETPAQWRATAALLRDGGFPTDTLILPVFDSVPGAAPGIEGWDVVQKELHAAGFRLVAALGPSPAASSTLAASERHWIQDAAPRVPDFTAAAARTWWTEAVAASMKSGLDGASLTTLQIAVPEAATLTADKPLGGPGNPLRYGGVLATFFARATNDGFGSQAANRRPFTVGDALRPTIHRSIATVVRPRSTGWDGLQQTVRDLLSASLSGQPLYGAELPDSIRTLDDRSLAAAWIGLSTLLPVSQSALRLDDAEPFPGDLQPILKRSLERRARLIPYYYTLCFNAFFACEPMVRPLFFENLTDQSLRNIDHAFLLGQDLLVVPRLSAEGKPSSPLPGGWVKLDLGDGDHPDLPDLYLRAGAAIPLGPVMAHTGQRPLDTLTVVFNLGAREAAVGRIYEDDGETYAFYRNQARRIGYRAERRDNSVLIRLAGLDFALPLPKRALAVRLLTDRGEFTAEGSERGTLKIDLPPVTPSP